MPRQPLSSGPWVGVRNTTDPLDDPGNLLVDAQNLYIPDPQGASGAYARPGINLQSWGNPLAATVKGQKSYTHVTLGGTVYTFLFVGGKVYRVASDWTTKTDVTPVAVTISATSRITCVSYMGYLVVSDGVNPPWYVADSGLSATPLSATAIYLNSGLTAWGALCGPVVYSGSLFFVLGGSSAIGSVSPGIGLVWCEPGTPGTGYNQTNYSDFWNLAQTAQGDPLVRALAPTNVGLYYFRRNAIGRIAGNPGLGDFSTNATHDSVSPEVGCVASSTVKVFASDGGNDTVFFCDQMGRPMMITPFSFAGPRDLWLNARAIMDANLAIAAQATMTVSVGIATIEPTLKLYLCAAHSPDPSTSKPPVELQAFDVRSGAYVGRWNIAGGVPIDTLDTVLDKNGRPTLIALAANSTTWTGTSNEGYVWTMNDPSTATWTDNSAVPTLSAKTGRLGYSAGTVWNADSFRALVMSTAPVTATIETPYTASTVECTPTPLSTNDGVNRVVGGLDTGNVRGIQITLSPTTATSQWGLQSVELTAVPSKAGVEDE